jgi:hypothetical protein
MRPWPWYYESPLFSAFQKATELEELQMEVGDERIRPYMVRLPRLRLRDGGLLVLCFIHRMAWNH